MPRLVSSDCICLEPLPKWPGGIYIVEPQNGRFCKLEDYPNRAGIYKVTIGG